MLGEILSEFRPFESSAMVLISRNSWFLMIEWALKEKVKGALEGYCVQTRELAEDRLSYDDWDILQHICTFLQAFYDATKATEGHKPTIDKVLPTMDFLLEHFETAATAYAYNEYMAP